MRIRDIMTRHLVTVNMDEPLCNIREIFEQWKFHHLVVLENGRLVGVISDRDLLKNISPFVGNAWMERQQDRNTLNRRAHQIMHRNPVTVTEDMPLIEASQLLLRRQVSCLPVVNEDGVVVGIVTWRDLMPHCFNCEVGSGAGSARSDAA
jgi:acetoin utilization protein AcuB